MYYVRYARVPNVPIHPVKFLPNLRSPPTHTRDTSPSEWPPYQVELEHPSQRIESARDGDKASGDVIPHLYDAAISPHICADSIDWPVRRVER
ncbi:unnamed protein product [Arctogadus glacialis]